MDRRFPMVARPIVRDTMVSLARSACLVDRFVEVICTETGRQPWVAHGILRTADAASPLAAHTVATTLVLFVLVYGIVFAVGICCINRLIARGVDGPAHAPGHGNSGAAARDRTQNLRREKMNNSSTK